MRNQRKVSELNKNSNFQVHSTSACHLQLNSRLFFCITENIGLNFKKRYTINTRSGYQVDES